MSEWKKVKLGDLTTKITKGTTPSNIGESFCSNGIPFIRSELITQYKYISYDGLLYISNETHEKLKRSQLEANDILFSMAGVYLGKTAILRECDVPANTNQAVALIRLNPMLCNVDYIYYFLNQKSVVSYVNQISGQAAQPNINLQQIGSIPILIPSREKQDNIATILSHYDSLIENYQKQIKLLEEAAQRLYKEWFVDFHFPGHENTKIVDGVPEGWEKKKVGDITPIKTGKKDANFGTSDGAYPFFTCSQEPIKAPSYSFDTSAVILAGNGDFNVKLYRGKFEAYQRTYVLEPTNERMLYLLYFCISENMSRLATGASGSTIKFLTKGMIESLDINEPSRRVTDSFNQIIEPIRTQKENLQTQIRLLTEARDRLLPKLMSGEIDINAPKGQ
jgi:type I restriction enzyme S subunit